MTIGAIVYNPEYIGSIPEIDYFLSRIVRYEKKKNCSAGVLLIQRRQFDGLYAIVSEEEAKQRLAEDITPTIPQFGIAYYPRAYFEAFRQKLEGRGVVVPEPIRRKPYRPS